MEARMEAVEKQKKLFQDVFTAQQYLINARRLRKDQWELCAAYIRPKEYIEIVEERVCARKCGYVMCDNDILTPEEFQAKKLEKYKSEHVIQRNIFDPPDPVPKQLLQYNRKKGEFVDVKEELNYCSKKCYIDSKVLSRTLDTSPINLREIPSASFKECAKILSDKISSKDEEMSDKSSVTIPARQLGHVREEIESVNASTMIADIKVSENQSIEAPSEVFEDKMEIEKEKISKRKKKIAIMELPLAAVMFQFIDDAVSDKTIGYLKTLEEDSNTKKTNEEDSSYWFPPLTSGYKRYEILQNAISNQYLTFQGCFGFDKSTLTFICRILKTFRYHNAVKLNSKNTILLTWILIFVASRYLPKTKQKLDVQLIQIKRMLRIDCGLRRGQFEDLLKVFDTEKAKTGFTIELHSKSQMQE